MNWILILLIVLGAYLIYQRNEGKSWKKIIGILLIGFGLLFIELSPDPISFGLYSITHGLTFSSMNAGTIPSVLWDFEVWSISIGIGLLILGAYVLGWGFKRVWKKINLGKYNVALIIAMLVVLAVALLDIWSANSGVFGSLFDYTSGNYTEGWFNLFIKFVLIVFAIPAICYFLLIKQDFSEAIGIFGFSIILYFGGLADIGYFIFQSLPIPQELPWLMGNPFISFISTSIGYSTVTNTSLLFSVFISFIIAWVFAKIMLEKL